MAVRVKMAAGWERRVKRKADKHVMAAAARVALGTVANIQAGGHVVTGALIRSVRGTREGLAHARVWIGTDHWMFIEYGTRPHLIRASKGGALRFVVGGRVVYTSSVRHPGNREYAVVRRALSSA